MINEWIRGKSGLVYAPIALLYAYVAYSLRDFPDWTIPFSSTVNLGIHEIGHEMFRAFGEVVYVAGGTLTELFIPLAFAAVAIKRGWLFLGLGCLLWATTVLRGAAIYAGDAVVKNLTLININGEVSSGSGVVGHDWEFLLSEFGLLDQAKGVETVFATIALVISIVVVAAAFYLTLRAFIGVAKKDFELPKSIGSIPATPYKKEVSRTVYSSDPIGYRKD